MPQAQAVAEGPELVMHLDNEGGDNGIAVRTSYEHEHVSTRGHMITPMGLTFMNLLGGLSTWSLIVYQVHR